MLPIPPAVRLALFYGAVFLVVGIYMPFWPVWLSSKGLGASEIGLLLAITTWTKVVASPAVAQIADRLGRRRPVMVGLALCTVASWSLYTLADGFWAMVPVAVLLGASFPPMMPIGENTTMLIAQARGLDYGRIRLWGSLSFIAAAWGGGHWLAGRPDGMIAGLILGGSLALVGACLVLPDLRTPPAPARRRSGPLRLLLRQPLFLLFLAAASLIQSSHAVLYGFGTLHWRSAGLADGTIGLLWAEGVIAEIALFAFSGRILSRFGVAPLMIAAAGAGVVRWTLTGLTTGLGVLALLQLLHALTFGATHLAAMHFIQRAAPEGASATAQGLYSAIAAGAVLALVMTASGQLYADFGGRAFYAMAVLAGLGGLAAAVLAGRWDGRRLDR
ncbi:MAG: 3-phenylpropionate MFS transporter [Alphaproteobacteria bacterium]|jgi:PPP family 3-phenylpropionic acid transporter|nr:3-phenylpropionate MFS transporter [Alphaproteobacteria bacterium]